MRIRWISAKSVTANLTIGYNCVTNVVVRTANSRLRGKTQALFVYAKHGNTRYEFVFTYLLPNSPRMFMTVQSVVKAYQTTALYRDLKLRGSFVRAKKLQLLPDEILDCVVEGVWNLAGESGHLGAFHVTNIRVVWHSMMNEVFNMSLPYLQTVHIKMQDSKYGSALVFETTPESGGYLLGFRYDPPEKLEELSARIQSFWKMALMNPIYGIKVEAEQSQEKQQLNQEFKSNYAQRDDVKILDERDVYFAQKGQKRAAYVQDEEVEEGDIVWDASVGLAIEKIKQEGVTLQDLWQY